ncbi:MAG: monovalent cation/H+ antiporter subunit D family protein [Eubacteriaceae bacterium]|nr:monovalent cation/H+ antiporter subunit D family protein [Eubacteriaceae bacterium]
MISENLPIIIVLLPFFAALLTPIIAFFQRVAARWYASAMVTTAFALSIWQLSKVTETGTIRYNFGGWEIPYGIEFVVDTLNGSIIVLVCFMGMLSMYFGMHFVKGLSRLKSGGFYTVLALLITGLMGMSSTGDLFNLYVFLEITSLSGYTLIALGGDSGVISAFRYLMIGTIGASFYLIGVAFIYAQTGSLNMSDVSELVSSGEATGSVLVASVCFIVAFGIKMALFPLHGWQPAAYSNSHPATTALIAGVMGKIPAYAMVRFFYFVFIGQRASLETLMTIVGVMGAAGMIYGSIIAIRQKNIRKMLAYSSIAQMGYIAVGIAIGNYYGLLGSVMHIIGHSLTKGGLFFAMGGVMYKYGTSSLNSMGQLYRKMPKTVVTIVIGALSMVGIPPTTGFFSKWYLALGACQSGQYWYVAVLVVSSLLNAIYFFRLLEKIFMDKEMTNANRMWDHRGELPWLMMIPIILCGLGIILTGLFNTEIVGILGIAVQGVV